MTQWQLGGYWKKLRVRKLFNTHWLPYPSLISLCFQSENPQKTIWYSFFSLFSFNAGHRGKGTIHACTFPKKIVLCIFSFFLYSKILNRYCCYCSYYLTSIQWNISPTSFYIICNDIWYTPFEEKEKLSEVSVSKFYCGLPELKTFP